MSNRKRRPAAVAVHDVVLVTLANWHEPAVIDKADFERLLALGFSDQWTTNGNPKAPGYVRCYHHGATGDLLTVARLIMQAPAGYVVKYRDGNRLNLRRSNLYLVPGRAKNREQAAIEDALTSH